MMLSTFYQMVKDIFSAAKKANADAMTVAQIDRSIQEIDRLVECDRRDAKERARKAKTEVIADFMRRGLYQTTTRESAERAVDTKLASELEDLQSEAVYARDMLRMEREKLASLIG